MSIVTKTTLDKFVDYHNTLNPIVSQAHVSRQMDCLTDMPFFTKWDSFV